MSEKRVIITGATGMVGGVRFESALKMRMFLLVGYELNAADI